MSRISTSLSELMRVAKKWGRRFDAPILSREERQASELRFERDPALERLRFPSMITSDMRLRQHDRANWWGVDPIIREFAGRLMLELEKQGVPFYAHSALRTPLEQMLVYKQGFSNIKKFGPHGAGCAVDLVHSKYHWELTKNEWLHVGIIGKRIAGRMNAKRKIADEFVLEWGGDWKDPFDPAHWQLSGWRSREQLEALGSSLRATPKKLITF